MKMKLRKFALALVLSLAILGAIVASNTPASASLGARYYCMRCFGMCFHATSEFINELLVLRHQYGYFHNDHFVFFDFHFEFNDDYDGNHYVNILELH